MEQSTKAKFTFEVCIDNLDSAKAAIDGGADRLEVCSALALGGLTPSKGLLITIREYLSTKKDANVHLAAMIRSRPGDFVYSDEEIYLMKTEIQVLHEVCDSFVFGCLIVADNGKIDVNKGHCGILLDACGTKTATFHRAIDVCSNLEISCAALVSLGFSRILTSGGASTALKGIGTIKQLNDSHGGQIIIMAGSGVSASNVPQIYLESKIFDYHSSCSVEFISPIDTFCGQIFSSGVAKWQVTDINKVIEMKRVIKEIEANQN